MLEQSRVDRAIARFQAAYPNQETNQRVSFAYARALRRSLDGGVTPSAEVWRYQVDTFNDSVYSRATADWSARSSIPADEFELDTGFAPQSGLRGAAIDEVIRQSPSYGNLFPPAGD